jgi:alanyl-tRNA synthetase
VGGSGGGKPDLAQAGGSDPAGIEKALEKVQELAELALG